MKKAVITLIVAGLIAGAGYGAYRTGYLQKYAGKYLGKVIPALSEEETEGDGRVSSTAENAVYLDSVKVLAGLDDVDGMIEKFAGVVEPQETKKYTVESGRTVDKTYVQEGDDVKKGDKLFTYDIDTMKDKLEQAQIDLERLQNSVDVSEARQAELEKQLQKASTPEKKLEALEEQNTLKQNKLELKSKQAKIESIKSQIENSTVVSDIDGVVKSVNQSAASGGGDDMNYSSGGDSSAYITLLRTGTYRIKASCNEQNIGSIYMQERVLVHSRVDDSRLWTGTITQIKTDQGTTDQENNAYYYGAGSGSDTGSTNYPFYVELDSSDGLMLGQHVYLEEDMGQGDKKEGIWLGNQYFVSENGGTYVWAASDDNKLEKRKVELGETDSELEETQVKSGLYENDYICLPADDLEEGLPVAYNDEDTVSLDGEEYFYEETENGLPDDLSDLGIPGLGTGDMEEALSSAGADDLSADAGLMDDGMSGEGMEIGDDSDAGMIPIDESEG